MLNIFKRKARREILDGEIFFISLVDEGANEVQALFKGKIDRPLQQIESVAKLNREGLLYTLVYGPDRVDTDGDTAGSEAVQKLAHKFIPNMVGSGIDIMHNCRPVDTDDAHVCESFIIQKNGDDRFAGVKIDGRVIEDTSELAGWWATVLKLNAPKLREPFESGEWTGVSMYGTALVEQVAKTQDPETTTRKDMDPKELAAALALAMQPILEGIEKISKAVTPEPSTEPVAKSTVPEFEGDPLSLEDIEAHEELVFKSSLDFSKSSDLGKWKAYLAKKAAKSAKPAEGAETDELKKAKAEAEAANARVQELSKASNQSTGDVQTSETTVEKMARIRKSAKETARDLLRSQGRLKD